MKPDKNTTQGLSEYTKPTHKVGRSQSSHQK